MPDSPDTSAASIVRDHPFEPRTERQLVVNRSDMSWTEPMYSPPNPVLCWHCRLAEAAHIR
jgi:hypothetical protein